MYFNFFLIMKEVFLKASTRNGSGVVGKRVKGDWKDFSYETL